MNSKPKAYPLPCLKLNEVIPVLEKDGEIYVQRIKAYTHTRLEYTFLLRSNTNLDHYIDRHIECVLEIIKARFFTPGAKDIPEDALHGNYLGSHGGYKFFPPLVALMDGTGKPDEPDFDEKAYARLAEKLFAGWGVSGLGMDIYSNKPMIRTGDAVLLLNEYQYEAETDAWEEEMRPKVPVCFCIDELLLHGIKLASDEDAEEFERWYQETLRKDARMKKKLEELQINKNHNSNTGAMSEKWDDEDIPEI